MTQTITFTQRRDAKPDYSDEEDRYELARMLLLEADLDSAGAFERVIEASWAARFNGFDYMCLRLVGEFTGLFPVRLDNEGGTFTIYLGNATAALQSPDDNVDFWQNDELVHEAARRAPRQWKIYEAQQEKLRRQFLALHSNGRFPYR